MSAITAIREGDRIPPLTRQVTRVSVFIFSASYFGTHRFHYDVEDARAHGFPDVIVTSNLICSYFEQAVRRWSGDVTALRSLEERSVAPTFAGNTLTVEGEVTAVTRAEDQTTVSCSLTATNEEGAVVSRCVVELELVGESPVTNQLD
jgi:acyl dehydratase